MNYEIIRSDRRTIAIQIKPDGRVIVRCPSRMPAAQIEAFVREKTPWIEKHMPQIPPQPRFTMDELHALADRALQVIPERACYFARKIGVSYGNITIRNQRSRWGSCSSQGNLNFNCLLMLVPPEVLDYVVVHELCHRIELNHSEKFWAEVEKILPDYQERRQWLKDHGGALIARL